MTKFDFNQLNENLLGIYNRSTEQSIFFPLSSSSDYKDNKINISNFGPKMTNPKIATISHLNYSDGNTAILNNRKPNSSVLYHKFMKTRTGKSKFNSSLLGESKSKSKIKINNIRENRNLILNLKPIIVRSTQTFKSSDHNSTLKLNNINK